MTLPIPFRLAGASLSVLALAGCSTLERVNPAGPPEAALAGGSDVAPVLTEHSFGLQCLGALIEDSGTEPIVVQVDTIRDRTIPARLNDRSRLSQASEWLVVTAISKLETPRVRSTLEDDLDDLDIQPAFTIDGAWTQDDELLRQSGGLADLRWLTGRLELGAERRFDYIAGDFVSRRNGIVDFSTAIGVFVGSNGVEARLLVDDGVNSADIGFDSRWADGPQLAQRRIAEAATLIHVARHFDIDYRPCLENGLGDPARFRASIERFATLSDHDRQRGAQAALAQLGHDPGRIDGVWGAQSREALMAYQAGRGIPVTGKLSSSVFALIEADASRSA